MKKILSLLFLIPLIFYSQFTQIDTVKLYEKNYQKSKIDYALKQESNSRLSTIPFYEIALKFNNDKNQKGIIGDVFFNLHKTEKKFNLTNLEINLYEIDSLSGNPGKKLNQTAIIYHPKNKSRKKVVINLEKRKISFPKNGIFVALKWLPNSNNDKQVGPSIRLTTYLKERLTYVRYKDREWQMRLGPNPSAYYDNAMIGTTVYYKKMKK